MTFELKIAALLLAVVFLLREFFSLKNSRPGKYITTPSVTVLVITVFIISSSFSVTGYKFFIFIALLLSLVADVLLMIEESDMMEYGIVFFALAHISYIMAFAPDYSFSSWNLSVAALLAFYGLFMFSRLKAKAGRFLKPVSVYIIIILLMTFFAVCRVSTVPLYSGITSASGALLFMVSDSIIAINLFIRPVRYSSVLIWLFYTPAQLLLSLS